MAERGATTPELIPPRTFAAATRLFLRFTSPRILILAAAAALTVRLALPGASAWDLVVVAGIVALWPILEWLIHVLLLHWKPRRLLGVTLDPLVARKHREHHRDPRHLPLVFIPVPAYLLVLPGLPLAWILAMPTPQLAWTGLAAFFAMALHYEWSHYVAHVPWNPRLYRRISKSHNLHHHKSERHWFGVSMLMADRLLGTRADPKSLPTSATVKTLGIEVDAA